MSGERRPTQQRHRLRAECNMSAASLSSIYALLDPRTTTVRYVGVARHPRRRLWRHIDDARKGGATHCNRWVAGLLHHGVEPQMIILESDVPREREVFWISHYRAQGADLTNLTDGGGGAVGYKHSPESVEKLRRRNTGRVVPPETRAAIAASLRGTRLSDESKAKISAVHKGMPKSDEMKRKLSATIKGRPKTEATKAKLSESALRRGQGRMEQRDASGRLLPATPQSDQVAAPTRLFGHLGERLRLSEWAQRAGIAASTLRARLNNGLSLEAAMSAPVAKRADMPEGPRHG
jgi:hypothetical protein